MDQIELTKEYRKETPVGRSNDEITRALIGGPVRLVRTLNRVGVRGIGAGLLRKYVARDHYATS